MELKEIELAIATKLTDAELERLIQAIQARQQMGKAASKTESISVQLPAEELMLLEAISSYMTEVGGDASTPGMLAKVSNFPAFRRKVPAVMAVLAKSNLKRNELRAVLRAAVSMLHEKLVEQGLETTSRRMMDHIHRLPAQLDQHFPGYAMMGHLGLIVRGKAKNANED